MSHHGREGEPTHSEEDYEQVCRDLQNCRQAIRVVIEQATDRQIPGGMRPAEIAIRNLTFFAIRAQIVPDPEEVKRQAQVRKQEIQQQMAKLQAELAKLA